MSSTRSGYKRLETFTVKDIINAIKTSLEFEFSRIQVTGEISNLSYSKTGHYYFNLSDKEASLSCAFFKGEALRNPIIRQLRDGDKVIISGPINVYAKRGTFQLIGKTITKAGKGDLLAQFEKLKSKLKKEGLFEKSNKKKIPRQLKRVAVLTASSGAAVHDFVNITKRKSIWSDILIIPCLVQGDRAPASLIKGLELAEKIEDISLIVLTRGGGSIEDLWAFNDEMLARSIFNCSKPIISAVGHQVDFTLADFVADLRLETPSAAAEYIAELQQDKVQKLQNLVKLLAQNFWRFKINTLNRIENVNPAHLAYLLERRVGIQKQQLARINFVQFEKWLSLNDKRMNLEECVDQINSSVNEKLKDYQHRLEKAERSLSALNPLEVLERGYSLIQFKDQVITSEKKFAKLTQEDVFQIKFYDGEGDVRKA